MSDKRIVVIFPGVNYSKDCPLLYYAGFKFEARGYERVAIDYSDSLKRDKSLDEHMENVKSDVLTKLKAIDFSKYSDIVFVSKSIGTVIAGWADEKLSIGARHIYLTPLKETLPYIKKGKKVIIVIDGTNDKHLNADILKEHCMKENIRLMQIEGVNHRLEVRGDTDKNIEILKEVVALF